jgi:hypothetical protein
MRALLTLALLLLQSAALAQTTAPAKTAATTATNRPPNFIFIQAEATGWSSTSVDMNGRMDGQPPDTVIHTGVKTTGVTTTGDVLRELSYATAHYGKWHVGRSDPRANGFDDSDGPNSNQGPDRGATPNPEQTAMITEKGIAFMCAVLVEMSVADSTYIFFSADYGAQGGGGGGGGGEKKKQQQGSNP